MMKKISIIICDDHQILVQGLKSLLKDHEEIEVIATANNGEELLQILKTKTPEIILLDIEMPLMDGLETLKHIKKINPFIKVLFLTIHSDKSTIQKIMNHGAQGYILKSAGKNELLEAIRKAKNGQIYMSDKATQILIEKEKLEALSENSENKIEKLTQREIEILKLITEGYSNTEIGSMLYISPRTVDTHRTNIMKKLNVKNIAGLIKYAIQNGI
jgi:DNA-binding NarL/FixJ family response regulator